jgi:hypothetical protein
MLKNKTYIGILKSGDAVSEHLEHLRIIDDSTFNQAQEMIAYNRLHKPSNNHLSRLKDQVLCADLIYCAHCEKKLGLTSNIKTHIKKDGTVKKRRSMRYICINKTRHYQCDGQTGYSAAKLDAAVVVLLSDEFRSNWLENKKRFDLPTTLGAARNASTGSK